MGLRVEAELKKYIIKRYILGPNYFSNTEH